VVARRRARDHRWTALARDPVLLLLLAVPVVAAVLLYAFRADPTRQAQVYWAGQPPLDVTLAACAWRVHLLATGAVRRFWLVIAICASAFAIGDTYQTVLAFVHPAAPSTVGGPVQSTILGIGQIALIITMLLHPHAVRSIRARLATWLDSLTVLFGGGVLAWCFAIQPEEARHAITTADAVGSAVAVIAGFAAFKMVLTGNAPMCRAAALSMTAAALMVGVVPYLNPGAAPTPASYWLQLVPSSLIAAGPRIQEILVRVGAVSFREAFPKAYSLVPYGSVLVALTALIVTLPEETTSRHWVAVAGVVAITLLVLGRQLLAFRDNARLIGRLDTTLGELRGHEIRLRDQAMSDGLTRLANRTHFNESLTAALVDLDHSRGLQLLLIDLDNFKIVNDTMGHAAGDLLLQEVGHRLRQAVRGGDLVARLGGDEFAVLLFGAVAEEAERAAARILAGLSAPITLLHADVTIGASIGLAGAEAGDDLESLLSDADIAMYAAKAAGRSVWVRYTADLGSHTRRVAELAALLREALDRDQFSLVYQPIVRLDTGALTGVEALLRWNTGTEQVRPIEFIPVAEESGLIVPIGRWVLRTACQQAGVWRRVHPGAADLIVNVNVAGRQLREPGFTALVESTLAESGLPPAGLCVEITETAVLDDENVLRTLHELRALGVRLALDDFGTAASSLGLLLTCPVTTLKLDRSFVEGIGTVDRQAAVAQAVSQIATALSLGSVAEGIETPDQVELLRAMGYEHGQGYLFARPLPPAQVSALLAWEAQQPRTVGALPS
jgi:diguanylate cyclase (GGDEF)-like protein